MAYDEKLAARIRRVLAARADVEEKKMFGGIAFMVNGHMAVGVSGNDLMVRVGAERHDEALARPHARPMDFTGRPMRGFVFVVPEGTASGAALRSWIGLATEVAESQPAKPKRRR